MAAKRDKKKWCITAWTPCIVRHSIIFAFDLSVYRTHRSYHSTLTEATTAVEWKDSSATK